MKLQVPRNVASAGSSCSSSMYRRFRRLRVTAIVYTCGSLCGILLFLNFNEEFKRLIQQEPQHFSSGPHEHDHDQEHATSIESALNNPRDLNLIGRTEGGGLEETSRVYSDENSQQSKVRQKLNLVASGSLTQSPKESLSKSWFMWRGTRFPSVATSSGKLWAEESPDSDRIIEQLMYITEEDINQLPSPSSSFPTAYGFGFGGIFGSSGSESSSGNGKKTMQTSSMTRRIINSDLRNIGSNGLREIRNSTPSTVPLAPKKVLPTQLKTILLYYGLGMSWGAHIISGRHVFMQQKCPVNACRLSGNRSQMNEADVVVFKDVFMNPKVKRSLDQFWVMYMLECPLNTQNFIDKNVFNLTATYRHDSDIVTPYEKWVYYDDNVRALKQEINYAAGKTKKVAWFVSNCVAKNNRLEYARELGKYIEVDIYGACGSHSCSRANAKQCFDLLSKTYKFYLAFENSNCRDYISEKFFVNGLGNNVLPIVMGAHPDDYKRAAPHKSYIHVDNFASPKELAKYLRELDEDDDAYNDYFKWKGTGEFVNTHFFCRLCAMVHYADRSRTPDGDLPSPRLYKDFNDWWKGPGVCTRRSWRNQVDIFAIKIIEEHERVTTSRFPISSLEKR